MKAKKKKGKKQKSEREREREGRNFLPVLAPSTFLSPRPSFLAPSFSRSVTRNFRRDRQLRAYLNARDSAIIIRKRIANMPRKLRNGRKASEKKRKRH